MDELTILKMKRAELENRIYDLTWVMEMLMHHIPEDEIFDLVMKRRRAFRKEVMYATDDIRRKEESLHKYF